MIPLRVAAASWAVCCAFAVWGCDTPGPSLVHVTGTVTLDGRPLSNASIHFTPTQGGRGSYSRIDEQGRYALHFLPGRPGALAGMHRVSISTADESGGSETVPSCYNRDSELTAAVSPGVTTIDFDLKLP